MLGGSADLSPSTKTNLTFDGAGDFQADDRSGRNLHFGIREHAAAAITNGMALTKLRSYWSGFLIFSDYARGAIRLSALMEIPVVHIFTHDSIGVGEDGPTHQPVEQLASLRAMPGLLVFRPADANEVVETWRIVAALHQRAGGADPFPPGAADPRPLAQLAPASGVAKGAYVLADAADGKPDVILLATGSEVQLALAARDELAAEGLAARVVSMPCWELFDRQPQEYRDSVLPARGQGPGRRRAGVHPRLGPLRRRRRRGRRHAHVRRIGTAEAAADEIRLHPRPVAEVARECVAAGRGAER